MSAGSGLDDALVAGLADWLTRERGHVDVEVQGLHRPRSGYSSETIFADAVWTHAGTRERRALVVRMAPPGASSFPHFDLTSQWQAQQAAAAAGIPVANPVLETDPAWLGAPFVLMDRVDGHVVGGLPHLDGWLDTLTDDGRGRVHRNLLAAMTDIHHAEVPAGSSIPRRDLGSELDYWESYLHWSSGGSPVSTLAEALRWCRRHRPDDEPAQALLWGDARFENAVFGDDLEVRAVLDWDMTSVGAPEHDLAWFTSLDLIAVHLFGRRASGFPDRDGTVAYFEERSGRRVRDLAWYETLAVLRSTAVMTRLGYLRQEAGKPPLLPLDDNPILDFLRPRLS